jgi:hypothetical protein
LIMDFFGQIKRHSRLVLLRRSFAQGDAPTLRSHKQRRYDVIVLHSSFFRISLSDCIVVLS